MLTALSSYGAGVRECVRILKGEKWSARAIFFYAVRNNLVYLIESDFVTSHKAQRPSNKSEYSWLRNVGGSVFVEFNFCASCGRGDVREYTYSQLRFLEERKNNR